MKNLSKAASAYIWTHLVMDVISFAAAVAIAVWLADKLLNVW